MEKLHSVSIHKELCVGCTNCIKECPTEAIRVREGKAVIADLRCIDCGECIRICPYHAKYAKIDSLNDLFQNADKNVYVAIVSPVLYTQFPHNTSRANVLLALKSLGFDYVFDESIGFSSYLKAVRATIDEMIEDAQPLSWREQREFFPLISTSCPVVTRLIQLKYRTIIPKLMQYSSPMETTAQVVRDTISVKNKDNICVTYVSPCSARKTQTLQPLGAKTSYIDRVVSIQEVYSKLIHILDDYREYDPLQLDKQGVFFSCKQQLRSAAVGGESLNIGIDNFLTVDGINNVMDILNEIESEQLEGIYFVEPYACSGGCVGGPLCVANRFTSKARLREISSDNKREKIFDPAIMDLPLSASKKWNEDLKDNKAMQLSDDITMAMTKFEKIEKILSTLPGLDCGACGAPSCAAMAEDIVQENAQIEDCIILRKGKMNMNENDK